MSALSEIDAAVKELHLTDVYKNTKDKVKYGRTHTGLAESHVLTARAIIDPPVVPSVPKMAQNATSGLITWDATPGATSYEVAILRTGKATEYIEIELNKPRSYQPVKYPGETVQYDVSAKPNIKWYSGGDANRLKFKWAGTVPIPDPPDGGPITPVPNPPGLRIGMVCPAWDVAIRRNALLHVTDIRVEFGINAKASDLDYLMDVAHKAGIRVMPLAGFGNQIMNLDINSVAANMKAWGQRFGPNGTFWVGKANPLPIEGIEIGNETGYSYMHSDNSSSAYEARGMKYANMVKAIYPQLSSTGVGTWAQLDDGNGWPWINALAKAVPDFIKYINAGTIHPYGTDGLSKWNNMKNQAAAKGWTNIIWIVTEFGIASDNGKSLSDNYGWPKNMTYQDAANQLHASLTSFKTTFGASLKRFFIYCTSDLRSSGSGEREDYFGGTKDDGSAKGAYTAQIIAEVTA